VNYDESTIIIEAFEKNIENGRLFVELSIFGKKNIV
jgi:hypothetical protein